MNKLNYDQTPLVVDFDGSIIKTDSLHEMIVLALRKPFVLLQSLFILLYRGKAAMKDFLASKFVLDLSLLPTNESVVNYVKSELQRGRKVEIASGANINFLKQVTEIFGKKIDVTGSTKHRNLTSVEKSNYLISKYGVKGYDYIGNSKSDIPVWENARKSYLASNKPLSEKSHGSLTRKIVFEQTFSAGDPSAIISWTKEIRIHQTAKNLLLFLPLIAAHQLFNLSDWFKILLGFICFSLVAFSVYILNDLLDLESDRRHSSKMFRSIANGQIKPLSGLFAGILFFVAGLLLGFNLGIPFGLVLAVYAMITIAYSFRLKKIAPLDVVILAVLYMIRIFAGSVLIQINLSFWFVGVTFFIFISLALAKRYTELFSFDSKPTLEVLPGRGYSKIDSLPILALGIASGLCSVLLLAIYIQASGVKILYPSYEILWLAIPVYLYWVANLWLESGRGRVHEDPILFALKNKQSIISAFAIVVIFILAALPSTSKMINGILY